MCWPLEAPEILQDAAGDLVIEGDFASIQWWSGEMELAGETGLILTAPGQGEYAVWVSDFLDCPATQSVTWTYVGVAERPDWTSWSVFPNPARDRVDVTFEPQWIGGEARLLGATGELIERRDLSASPLQWTVSGLPAGAYFLQMSGPQGQAAVRRLLVD